MKLITTTLILLLSLYSVSAQETAAITSFEGTYKVTTLLSEDVSNANITLTVNSKKNSITGNTGCNAYLTDYIKKNKKLQFSLIASTKKSCGHSEIEKNYLSNLAEITSYTKEGNTLILYKNEEKVITAIGK